MGIMSSWGSKLPKGATYRQCTNCDWRGSTTNKKKLMGKCPECKKMTYKLHIIK